MPEISIRGFTIYQGLLPVEEQSVILDAVRDIVRAAPLFRPKTAQGKQMSVQMTSAGQYGWISDRAGYRYENHHPSGIAWPHIPQSVLKIWNRVSGVCREPECCLVNFYDQDAKMGLHQDKDEADFSWPVVSVSIGDEALFRMGNKTRGGKTQSIWLRSGDVVVMGGDARLCYHGVDRVRFKSSTLLQNGGRINLTLRVVN